jgi:hypothetical protein
MASEKDLFNPRMDTKCCEGEFQEPPIMIQ